MTQGTAHPITPPLDTPSGWGSPDEIVAMSPAGPIAADYDWLIVGAGITGLSAARRLAETAPGESVLLVDARPVGWGTSGRNSGFLVDLPHKFELDSRDPDFLRRIARLNRETIADLKAAIAAHGIDCGWSEAGKLQAARGPGGIALLDGYAEVLGIVGEEFRRLDRAACAAILGTDHYAQAVFTPGCVLVDPFRLVRGLAAALGPSVTLRDDTAVTAFTPVARGGAAVRLRRADGSAADVRARRVILGTDPFTAQFGYMADRLIPAMTYASFTRRLTAPEIASWGGSLGWGLTPADPGGTTLRMTADGRLLIRREYHYAPRYRADGQTLARVAEIHRRGIAARFPALAEVPLASTWAGVVSLSRNRATFFGEVGPGVYSATCYNGVGMVRGALSGRLLVDLARGLQTRDLADMRAISALPSRLPPQPFLGLGVRGRLRLTAWQSRGEH